MDKLLANLHVCVLDTAPSSDSTYYFRIKKKKLPQNLLLYFCCMFNRILAQEIVATGWRETIFTMLHKKGPYNDSSNYKGIALLNPLEKVFSQILLVQLCD